MSFNNCDLPIFVDKLPLVRGVTIYGPIARKPCTNCGCFVSSDNVENCTRYKGGKLLCSDVCRDKYIEIHNSLPSS